MDKMTNIKDTHLKIQNYGKLIFQELKKLLYIGITEKEAYTKISDFLKQHNDIDRLWHPIVIKFDSSTAIPEVSYKPSEKTLSRIVTIDIGIVIKGFEVDYAETWLVSSSQNLQNMIDSAKNVLSIASANITSYSPKNLFFEIKHLIDETGYLHVAKTAGHRLGKFPTKKSLIKIRENEEAIHFDKGGWVIEIHLTDGKHGAFFEDLVFI